MRQRNPTFTNNVGFHYRFTQPTKLSVISTLVGGVFDLGENINTVNHARGTQIDGIDTLENIEFAQFGINN